MTARYNKIVFFISFCILLLSVDKSYAKTDIDEQHIKVSMRMIGHKVLLTSGDSTSRVLAIEKEEDRYKIEFESDFEFHPGELALVIDQIVKTSAIANAYLVEVEECESKSVIYSYEMGSPTIPELEMIPCGGRLQPKACYKIFFTILDSSKVVKTSIITVAPTTTGIAPSTEEKGMNYTLFLLLLIPLAILFAWFIYSKKEKSEVQPQVKTNSEIIPIGAYQFDKRNMALLHEDTRTVLTGKEADLLLLLLSSSNIILERENILKKVWGDEGDYIGRTLDVFISKLRKKLAADSNLKIVNIRGVGYKFVVNG